MPVKCYAVSYGHPDDNRGKANCYTEDGFGSMRGGEIVFTSLPEDIEDAEWLFVSELPYASFYTRIPRERRVLFLMEPPIISKNPRNYLEQFGTVVSPLEIKGYTGRLIRDNPHAGWFAGTSIGGKGTSEAVFKTLSDVRGFTCEKTKSIAMVSSLKTMVPGHHARVNFMNTLKQRFGNVIDFFGRDTAPIDDKLEAIAPYKYHIAIENCNVMNSWTEKRPDAWVGWSLPIYYGDPTILDQLPDPLGIEVIDIKDEREAMSRIEAIMRNDPYESRLPAIKKCRDWVIKESNMYEKACQIVETADDATRSKSRLSGKELICIKKSGRTGFVYDALWNLFGKKTAHQFLQTYREMQSIFPKKK